MIRVFGAKQENACTLGKVLDTHAPPLLRSLLSVRKAPAVVPHPAMLRIAELTQNLLHCALMEVLDHGFALRKVVLADGLINAQHQLPLTKIPVKLFDAVLVLLVLSTMRERQNVYTISDTPLPVEEVMLPVLVVLVTNLLVQWPVLFAPTIIVVNAPPFGPKMAEN